MADLINAQGLPSFTAVSALGFTVTVGGVSQNITKSGYDAVGGTCHRYNAGATTYLVSPTFVTAIHGQHTLHVQSVASMQWTVTHEQGKHVTVSVTVLHNGNTTVIYPDDVVLVDGNTALVKFTTARTGTVAIK